MLNAEECAVLLAARKYKDVHAKEIAAYNAWSAVKDKNGVKDKAKIYNNAVDKAADGMDAFRELMKAVDALD